MLYLLLIFVIVCLMFFFMFQFLGPQEFRNTVRDITYALIVVITILICAMYQDYADVTCKDRGGIRVRGALLYSCVPLKGRQNV